jgi:hypothetical protein
MVAALRSTALAAAPAERRPMLDQPSQSARSIVIGCSLGESLTLYQIASGRGPKRMSPVLPVKDLSLDTKGKLGGSFTLKVFIESLPLAPRKAR